MRLLKNSINFNRIPSLQDTEFDTKLDTHIKYGKFQQRPNKALKEFTHQFSSKEILSTSQQQFCFQKKMKSKTYRVENNLRNEAPTYEHLN